LSLQWYTFYCDIQQYLMIWFEEMCAGMTETSDTMQSAKSTTHFGSTELLSTWGFQDFVKRFRAHRCHAQFHWCSGWDVADQQKRARAVWKRCLLWLTLQSQSQAALRAAPLCAAFPSGPPTAPLGSVYLFSFNPLYFTCAMYFAGIFRSIPSNMKFQVTWRPFYEKD